MNPPGISPTPAKSVLQCRQAVWANGFRPVPVRTGEKVPSESKWSDRARMDPPPCTRSDAVLSDAALNTGILADGLCVIDVDIDDVEMSELVAQLASDILGGAPTRYRSDSPRFLTLYRAAEGEPKKRALKGKSGAVEILGMGQQFVAFGQHPNGADYEWAAGSPDALERKQLSPVTDDQITEFLAACAPLIDAAPCSIQQPAKQRVPVTLHAPGTSAWGRSALDGECDRIASAQPGAQSDTLARAAFKVGQRIAAGEIDRAEAQQALLSAGMQMINGDLKRRWAERDIMKVIQRQIETGHANPVGPDRVDLGVIVDLDISIGRAEAKTSVDAVLPSSTKTPIVPVPADAPPMNFKHPAWGKPQQAWGYRDAAGQLVGYVARWPASAADAGQVTHITYCDLGQGKRGWRMKSMPAPRPLFDLPAILARPAAPILFCADEWAADAAAMLLPEMVATTTAHDAKSPISTDFSPLAGRSVILVPAIGREGQAWADMIHHEAAKAGAGNVKALDLSRLSAGMGDYLPPPGDGWSIVDAADAGLSAAALAALINTDPELIGFHRDERQKRTAEAALNPDVVPDADDALPLFKSDSTGVYKLVERQEMGETRTEYFKFCSPLAVVAETRDADGQNWGRLIEVTDRDRNTKQWAMPMSMLAGDGTVYREHLLSMGIDPAPGKKSREFLYEFISYARPKEKARCVSRTGWHGSAYVAVNETLRTEAANERLLLQSAVPPDHPFRTAGNLAGWQDEIARYAVGNSRLALAIAAAFAAPLLYLLDAEGGGFHFRGASSTGKSTALAVGGSVWGGGGLNGFLRTWRATSNGLEGVAALHCDALLCLDEMGQVDGREAGAIAYMLANGSGKSRAGRTGESRAAAGWRVLFLSSGEISLSDKLAEDGRGRRAAAGQEVRIVDIPADAGAGLGLFEELYGFETADAFARHLKSAVARNYGCASRAFLQMTVELFDEVQTKARKLIEQFGSAHCPPHADGQISRVAARFGLIAAAGEIAREAGILPWPEGEATRAAAKCFNDWMAQRGGIEPAEERSAIAQVRHFIEQHGASRFEPMGSGYEPHPDMRVVNRVGFRSGDERSGYEYIVLPEAWKSVICTGLDASFVTKALAKRGLLKIGNDGKAQIKQRLPGFEGPVRCYVVRSTIMGEADG